MRCGGQDSNLRTNKEWDLNPPPLTKLGDPRADWGRRLLDLKQAIHWDAEKPAFSITVMISCAEMFSVVVMVPLSVACDTSAPITSGWFSRTPLSRLEQPPQLMPVIRSWRTTPPMRQPQGRSSSCFALRHYSLAGVQPRNTREFTTTLKEEKDIAAAANEGGSKNPVIGNIMPIANGIPTKL